jgi:hypothetical protein
MLPLLSDPLQAMSNQGLKGRQSVTDKKGQRF